MGNVYPLTGDVYGAIALEAAYQMVVVQHNEGWSRQRFMREGQRLVAEMDRRRRKARAHIKRTIRDLA